MDYLNEDELFKFLNLDNESKKKIKNSDKNLFVGPIELMIGKGYIFKKLCVISKNISLCFFKLEITV